MDNFQKTVNLKDKMEKERQRMLYGEPEKTEKKVKSKAEAIDEVYEQKGNSSGEDNLRRINRPIANNVNEKLIKNIIISLAIILVATTVYFLVFRNTGEQAEKNNQNNNWYAVKLDNNEMYYGQIENTSADPVMIKNVYYDYDQLNKTEGSDKPAGSLRLVKKGKETYGPSGTMGVYHAKITSLDLLSQDSKVLKAILDYENKGK